MHRNYVTPVPQKDQYDPQNPPQRVPLEDWHPTASVGDMALWVCTCPNPVSTVATRDGIVELAALHGELVSRVGS